MWAAFLTSWVTVNIVQLSTCEGFLQSQGGWGEGHYKMYKSIILSAVLKCLSQKC
jgi:hypothetical protein